ncbi:MAG: AAA family ATPase [Methanomicrobiales archaeon]|nr:AAA family ATPase [Methanomicrobiales archaeon]
MELMKIYQGKETTITLHKDTVTGKRVIHKSLDRIPSHDALDALTNEYRICHETTLSPIRKAISKDIIDGRTTIILEYIDGVTISPGNVNRRSFIESFLRLAIKISSSIVILHKNKIIHGNLTGDNVLHEKKTGRIYLIDFGLATISTGSIIADHDHPKGSFTHMAPEQTGRMDCGYDTRADLYTIGVTLYELLTGTLPFSETDPVALIHSHLTKIPVSPSDRNPKIPRQISAIIMHLLEKDPENRYQTAEGLVSDLEKCLLDIREKGRIKQFEIGISDYSGILTFPKKIYGRKKEIEQIKIITSRISSARTELLLVKGYSGIGKTTLVQEIRPFVQKNGGVFISGKYHQFQEIRPYAGWIQALSDLVNQLLMGSDDELNIIATKIREAVGNSGKLLTDLIPDLEKIIGKQPDIPDLGGIEAVNRFNYLIQRFIGTISNHEHPLVVFLDDLQWVDEASLELLETLLTSPDIESFLVIGAYRENEVDISHPLSIRISSLVGLKVLITTIPVGKLQKKSLNILLADLFHASKDEISPVSEILIAKTDGNIFFIRQVLSTLVSREAISFSSLSHRWEWQIMAIQETFISDNVVDVITLKIQTLPSDIRKILLYASCIGNPFDRELLGRITGENEETIDHFIQETLQGGFIVPGTDGYLFSHDRVYQASYSLVPEPIRIKIHRLIGDYYLYKTPKTLIHENIFSIVRHLNVPGVIRDIREDKRQSARLNLIAGKRAKKEAAYRSALQYFRKGITVFENEAFDADYQLSLELYQEAANAAYLTGQLDEMKKYADIVHQSAKTTLDKVPVILTEIDALVSRGEILAAIDYGFGFIKEFGFTIPKEPTNEEIEERVGRALALIHSIGIENIPKLPEMTRPDIMAAIETMTPLGFLLYSTAPKRCIYQSSMSCEITLLHGNSLMAPQDYIGFSCALMMLQKEVKTAYELAKMALNMTLSNPVHITNSLVLNIFACIIQPWNEPLQNSIQTLEEGISRGIESGNFTYACLDAVHSCPAAIYSGRQLSEVYDRIRKNLEIISLLKQPYFIGLLLNYLFTIQHLTTIECTDLTSEFDDRFWVESAVNTEDYHGLSIHYVTRLMCHYIMDEEMVKEYSLDVLQYNSAIQGSFAYPVSLFYSSLALLRYYDIKNNSHEIIRVITENLDQLQAIAEIAPMNYQHQYDLVRAELCRVHNEYWDALKLYEKAINGARKNGFIHEEAVGSELAGCFLLSCGMDDIAGIYLKNAYTCYTQWEALLKTKQLEELYPQYFSGGMLESSSSLDSLMVMKATQAISREVDLKRLLCIMTKVLMETAGAERGILMMERDGTFYIEAYRDMNSEPKILQSIPMDSDPGIPSAIISYVIRTGKMLILPDAMNEGQFTNDPAVIMRNIRSLICIPLHSRGSIRAVLYLENNKLTHAFTPVLTEVLEILSVQAAISLENSWYYEELIQYRDHLEDLIKERTLELNFAKEEAETANQAKSLFLSGMSHELRTPLNSILGYSDILKHQSNITPDQKQQLDIIKNSGQHLLGLINDLLDLGRIESGKIEIDLSPVNLKQVIATVINITRIKAMEKNLQIIIEHHTTLPAFVLADEHKITQIFINILNNAVKYTQIGCITIRTRYEQPGRFFFEVEDTGIGIPSNMKDKIFDPFVRISAEGEKVEGTGLGLSITKKLADLMGGRVWFSSEEGKGSIFYVELSLPITECSDVPSEKDRIITGYIGQVKTVLVVEDNPANASLLFSILEPIGFIVYIADNGYDALRLFQEIRPELVLLDFVMEGFDGMRVVDELRKTPSSDLVKIIGISATVSEDLEKNQFKSHTDAFIEKPVKIPLLMDTIRDLCNLTWIYKEPEQADVSISGKSHPVPPQKILNSLYIASMKGDYREMEIILEEIERKNPAYVSFCTDLKKLVSQYEEEKIRQYLNKMKK